MFQLGMPPPLVLWKVKRRWWYRRDDRDNSTSLPIAYYAKATLVGCGSVVQRCYRGTWMLVTNNTCSLHCVSRVTQRPCYCVTPRACTALLHAGPVSITQQRKSSKCPGVAGHPHHAVPPFNWLGPSSGNSLLYVGFTGLDFSLIPGEKATSFVAEIEPMTLDNANCNSAE